MRLSACLPISEGTSVRPVDRVRCVERGRQKRQGTGQRGIEDPGTTVTGLMDVPRANAF